MGGALKSWAVPKGPSLNPNDKHLAMMVEDHPFEYRDFEGVIPEGNYGAGTVMIWDEGTYEPVVWDKKTGQTLQLSREEQDKAARHMAHQGHLTIILHGKKLKGEFALVKMQHADDEKAWLLIKADKDKYAGKGDVLKNDKSARSGKTMEQLSHSDKTWESDHQTAQKGTAKLKLPAAAPKAPMPHAVKPMLATLVEEPFDQDGWYYEVKWDGYRIIAHMDHGKVTLQSRNLQDYTQRFAPIALELEHLDHQAILDGELVAVDKAGRSSFQLLQNYQRTGEGRLMYYVFDLLYGGGRNLMGLPLAERKSQLKKLLPKSDWVKYSDHVEHDGVKFFQAASHKGLEGIMAKDATSTYLPGKRTKAWLKIKTHMQQEVVIGGFTEPRASRKYFGALVVGVYDKGKLVYTGHVGGGFDEPTLAMVYKKLKPLARQSSPFVGEVKTNEPVTWVSPRLLAEVSFAEWTGDGQMRQPIFLGLRTDKSPRLVHRERASKHGH
jgi:bifunctional non-homologous end joining protein LigD